MFLARSRSIAAAAAAAAPHIDDPLAVDEGDEGSSNLNMKVEEFE